MDLCKHCQKPVRVDMGEDLIHNHLDIKGVDPRKCYPNKSNSTYAELSKQCQKCGVSETNQSMLCPKNSGNYHIFENTSKQKEVKKPVTVRQLIHILIELPMDDEVYARNEEGYQIPVHLVHKEKEANPDIIEFKSHELKALFG